MITVVAPVRVCDLGGWTDTWFGGPGLVVNLAVMPGIEVTISPARGDDPVVLDVGAFGDRFAMTPGAHRAPRHPLIEAVIDEHPPSQSIEVAARSEIPAGCGAGTSAAIAVALLAALVALDGDEPVPMQLAAEAHRIETEVLGLESGVQDQIGAACGGINAIEIDPYPEVAVEALPAWPDLDGRLSLVSLGRGHDSSSIHRDIIDHVRGQGSEVFDRLRAAADAGRDAVRERDVGAFAAAMCANNDAQAALHPSLVCADARAVIELARGHGAIGWKVNGAGGDGGSLTVLSASREERVEFEAAVGRAHPEFPVIPLTVNTTGVVVSEW